MNNLNLRGNYMINLSSGIRIIALFLAGIIIIFGLIFVDFYNLPDKAACLTVMAMMPEGISGFPYSKSENKTDTNNDILFEIVDNNVSFDNTEASVTVAVPETVIGSVIKKTLTPYNANTSFSSVYLNNQCGANIDISSYLSKKLPYSIQKGSEPQILIYHTHTTESYMDNENEYYTDGDEPRTTDEDKNVVAVGERIRQQLEKAGFSVIHDKTVHDHPGFSGSYSRSAKTVKNILKKYPQVKIAIDLHRDSIASGSNDKVAPVVNIDGKDAAQVMLVMGSETGSIENYPNWQTNLHLAIKLQQIFENRYPQFARSILLRSAKYNQDLTPGSILIEMGSDANTLEQALYSGDLVGRCLVDLLK